MKQEFEMTQQEMDDTIAINKSQLPIMKFGDHWSGLDLQEKINHYWETLGNKYGFKHLTVERSSKGKLFFIAEPKPKVIPKTATEKAMDKFDTLEKIIDQLESCYTAEHKEYVGSIALNVAFMSLRRMANLDPNIPKLIKES